MRHTRLLLFFLFALPSRAQYVQSAYIANAIPAQATFSGANTAGDALVAILGYTPSGSTATPTFADTKLNTYNLVGCDFPKLSGFQVCVYVALNCVAASAGTNTVTATEPGGSFSALSGAIMEYSGVLSVSGFDASIFASGTTWPQTTSAFSVDSNEILISYGLNDFSNNGTWSSPTAGFTFRAAYNDPAFMQVTLYDQIPSAGAYSWGINSTGGSHDRDAHVGMISLRKVLPVIGQMESAISNCSSCTTLTTPFTASVPSGDGIVANLYWTANMSTAGCLPVLSTNVDPAGSFKISPVVYLSDGLNQHRADYYLPNTVGGSVSVTATSTGCSQNLELAIQHVRGMSHSTPLYNAASGGLSSTPQAMGPITGTSGMWADTNAGGVSSYSPLWTATSGFTPRLPIINNYPPYIYTSQTWDMPTGSTTANTIATSGAANGTWGSLLVFSPTDNTFLFPSNVGGNSSGLSVTQATAYTLKPSVVAGDRIVAFSVYFSAPATPHPITDSQSNSYTDLEGGDTVKLFDLATTILGSSGSSFNVTSNPGDAVSIYTAEIPPSTVDGHNSGSTASGTSQSTGSITTTHAGDLIYILCGLPANRNVTTWPSPTLPTGTTLLFTLPGHSGGLQFVYQAINMPIGTYSATCVNDTSVPLIAAIAAFAPTTPTSQPLTTQQVF